MARGFMYADGASADVELARRQDLSKAQLVDMGQSRNDLVREVIGGRPDCPLGIMVTLTHDKVVDVRAAVARNPSASRTVLEHLARDKHAPVLEALVGNPSLPADMLEQLAFHRRPEVRAQVAARLDALEPAPLRVQDTATPELRDHIFDKRSGATVVDISTGREPVPVVSMAYEAEPVAPTAPTRTAPVRGFRPPEAS